ncbi:thioredoxin [Pontibacter chitinilyticus]|uniref:thioredoxin n=1 Tax=Pontibacter chitinilyticus TaxID=2674989 RepID=UPI00321A5F72
MAKKSFQELISSPGMPVLVDFYADWCGPCKAMSPIVQQVAGEYNGKLKVIKINIDNNQAAAAQYRVQGVPTFIIFHQGKQVWRQSGAMPAHVLKQAIQQSIG